MHYSKQLTEMGHKVLLIVFSNLSSTEIQVQGVEVVTLSSATRRVVSSLFTALRCALGFRADSVFFITGGTTLFGVLFLLFSSLLMRSGILIYGKDILSAKKRLFNRLLFNLAFFLSRRVGVNSRATAGLLPGWIAPKTRLLYPGVDIDLPSSVTKSRGRSAERVLFVGRLVRRKGADDLIKAFHLLAEELPDAELEIVGDGPEMAGLKGLVRLLDIEGKVRFLGELSGVPLYKRYSECDVFCMPSKRLRADVEGFGIVFLEAGLFGKPSVGTWSGGIPEAVVHGETGLLVREGDVAGLKEALKGLLVDRGLSRRLGENAQRRVLEEFSWRRATDRLLDML